MPRTRSMTEEADAHVRAYSLVPRPDDLQALRIELAATQALVRAAAVAEVGAIVSTLVHDLGGVLVPARTADPATVSPSTPHSV